MSPWQLSWSTFTEKIHSTLNNKYNTQNVIPRAGNVEFAFNEAVTPVTSDWGEDDLKDNNVSI